MANPYFDAERSGTGTHEWSERTENIARGCPSGCLYCFAAENAHRFKWRDRRNWAFEELTKKAFIKSYPKRPGVIMYPSSHDITPFNVEQFIHVGLLMLRAGNTVLIVSKPRLDCISRVVEAFAPFRESIMFRFTIGTVDDAVAAHWEPHAPLPQERIAALRLAHENGFRTSVSAEPLLGGTETAIAVLGSVRPYVTDTVWIGKMNHIRRRVDLSSGKNLAAAELIESAQTDEEVLRMVAALDGDPMVRWKDSIKAVFGRGATEATPGDTTVAVGMQSTVKP